MTKLGRVFRFWVFGAGLILVLQGCAMMEASRKQKAERLEKIEQQKENYQALKKDLDEKKVKVGTTQSEIRERYGEPNDTFGTASGVSNFALWYYEFPDAGQGSGQGDSYSPLRLYFNDKKLSYWSE
jgi:Flp pilus assembly protein TadB